MKHIQILVDNKYRDLYPAILLKLYIINNTNKIRVILANKKNQHALYKAFCPEIVVLPHCSGHMNYHINYMKNRSRIVVMPSAGSTFSKKYVYERYINNTEDENFKVISRVYLWGEAVRDILFETKKYNEGSLIVTGTPRLDVFKLMNQNVNNLGTHIGFGTSIRHLSSINNFTVLRLIEIYSKLHQHNSQKIFWKKGGQYADWLWYEVAFLETLSVAVKRILNIGLDNKIIIRPHPFESVDFYRHWIKYYNYAVDVTKDEYLWDFYSKLSVFIQVFSTTSVEAIYSGIPVISLKYLMGDRVQDHIPKESYDSFLDDFLWRPRTIDELLDLVNKAVNGKLSPYPDDNKLGLIKKLHQLYNFNSDKLATELIGNDLIDMINVKVGNYSRFSSRNFLKYLLLESILLLRKYKRNDYNYSTFRMRDKVNYRDMRKFLDLIV
tara:strand:- start:582 stop:1895 length:1314 start_codon:yes stop_codon:yes gene_type:complete